MKQIKSNAQEYEQEYINAKVFDDHIVPGLYGQKVDLQKSYYEMHEQNTFLPHKLVYKEIKPKISIDNNKGLLIKNGRYDKNSVAIIFYNNKFLLKQSHLNLTRLVTKKNENSSFEEISLDYHDNNKICFIIDDDNCPKDYYRITYTYTISNYLEIKGRIKSGDIILINDQMTKIDIKLLLKEIAYHDLKIEYLTNLISEKR